MLEAELTSIPGSHDVVVDACWGSIGTRGDNSCPRLQDYFRCLNCPTYAAGAALLLDRPSLGAVDDMAWHGQDEDERSNVDAATASMLIFRVGSEWLGLPTRAIVEVIEPRTIHCLPHQANPAVLGLTNIRGTLKICVALSRMMALAESHAKNVTRALVVEHEQQVLVFPVDEVAGVHTYAATHLQPPPATVQQAGTTYTQAMLSWRNEQVGLLDCGLLFYAVNRSLT
jgi:chemotaxis-related protein WspD